MSGVPSSTLELFMPSLIAALGRLSGGGGYAPGMFGSNVVGGAANMLMPGNPLAGGLAAMYGPQLQQSLFGGNMLAGYGGPGSTWNVATRQMEMDKHHLNMAMNTTTSRETDYYLRDEYKKMMQGRYKSPQEFNKAWPTLEAGMGSDLRFQALRLGPALEGISGIGIGVQNAANSFGYRYGAGNDWQRSRNAFAQHQMGELTRGLVGDSLRQGEKFGSLSGREIGAVANDEITFGVSGNNGDGVQDISSLRRRIQSTSRKLSGLKDLLGDANNAIGILTDTFGSETKTVVGTGKLADAANNMRFMAEATGHDPMETMRTAAGVSTLTKQLTGRRSGALASSQMAAAQMSTVARNVMGVDQSELFESIVTKTVGANESDTARSIGAAVVIARRRGGEGAAQALQSRIMGQMRSGKMPTLADIARMAGASEMDIVVGRDTKAAIDETTKGTFAGEATDQLNANRYWQSSRGVLKAALGSKYKAGMEKMQLRDLEEAMTGSGVSMNLQGAVVRQLEEQSKRITGYSADVSTLRYNTLDTGRQALAESNRKRAIADKYALAGGGITGLLKKMGPGGMMNADARDGLNTFMGVLDKNKADSALQELMGGDAVDMLTTASAFSEGGGMRQFIDGGNLFARAFNSTEQQKRHKDRLDSMKANGDGATKSALDRYGKAFNGNGGNHEKAMVSLKAAERKLVEAAMQNEHNAGDDIFVDAETRKNTTKEQALAYIARLKESNPKLNGLKELEEKIKKGSTFSDAFDKSGNKDEIRKASSTQAEKAALRRKEPRVEAEALDIFEKITQVGDESGFSRETELQELDGMIKSTHDTKNKDKLIAIRDAIKKDTTEKERIGTVVKKEDISNLRLLSKIRVKENEQRRLKSRGDATNFEKMKLGRVDNKFETAMKAEAKEIQEMDSFSFEEKEAATAFIKDGLNLKDTDQIDALAKASRRLADSKISDADRAGNSDIRAKVGKAAFERASLSNEDVFGNKLTNKQRTAYLQAMANARKDGKPSTYTAYKIDEKGNRVSFTKSTSDVDAEFNRQVKEELAKDAYNRANVDGEFKDPSKKTVREREKDSQAILKDILDPNALSAEERKALGKTGDVFKGDIFKGKKGDEWRKRINNATSNEEKAELLLAAEKDGAVVGDGMLSKDRRDQLAATVKATEGILSGAGLNTHKKAEAELNRDEEQRNKFRAGAKEVADANKLTLDRMVKTIMEAVEKIKTNFP